MKIADIEGKKLAELRDIAHSMNLTGYSTLRKQDLVKRIVEAQNVVTFRMGPSNFMYVLSWELQESPDQAQKHFSYPPAKALALVKMAHEVFGSEEKTRKWFKTPLPMLGGKTPLECFVTEAGALEIEDILGRIAHGVFS